MAELDASHIIGKLYVGSFPPLGSVLRKYMDVVVLCAQERQVDKNNFRGMSVRHCPLYDDGTPMDEQEHNRARVVARHIRRDLDRGRRVLVTCMAGLNRSALVGGLALMMPSGLSMNRVLDHSTPSCLNSVQVTFLMRRARGERALSNPWFVRELQAYNGICGARVRTFDFNKWLF